MILVHSHYVCVYCFKDTPMVLLHLHYVYDYCFKDIPWYFCILIMSVFTVLRIPRGTFSFSLCLCLLF